MQPADSLSVSINKLERKHIYYTCAAIVALNGVVFAMWRVRRLSQFMDKFFISSITQREGISCFS